MKKQLAWLPMLLGALGLSLSPVVEPRPSAQEGLSEQEGSTIEGPADLISNDGTYLVHWTHPDGELEFGERFRLIVDIRRADGEPLAGTLAIDSRMPEHGHGMKREPQITLVEAGRFEVSGMLFHMPGYWEIYFDLTLGAITERTQVSVDLY